MEITNEPNEIKAEPLSPNEVKANANGRELLTPGEEQTDSHGRVSIGVCLTPAMKQIMDNASEEDRELMARQLSHLIKSGKDVGPRVILSMLRKHVDAFVKHLSTQPDVACRRGCHHCCKIHVTASEPECEEIVKFCVDNNVTLDKEYLSLLADLTEATWGNKRCPFLSLEGECKVYEVRPIACRKYHVQGTPETSGKCDQSQGTQMVPSIYSEHLEAMVSAYWTITASENMSKAMLSVLDKQTNQA